MAIKVLIVDDSITVRQVMSNVLAQETDIQIIGTATDPLDARKQMKVQWPDVIILDIEMPHMDGLTFLRQIMAARPTPVVICSTLTKHGAAITLEALSAGALSIVTKPSLGVREFLQDSSADLVSAIHAAYAAKGKVHCAIPAPAVVKPTPEKHPAATKAPIGADSMSFVQEKIQSPKLTADAILEAPTGMPLVGTTEQIVAIGISTGGVQALEFVLPRLSTNCPPLAIVQHMPEGFTASFAERLNGLCKIEVKEAANNDRLQRGRALIAPGGKHMLIKRGTGYYFVEIVGGPLVTRHRPSVDVLFRSAAKSAGSNATGIIMTGMGDDGSKGMKEMKDCGARTVAQDEISCTVFGMPKEAIRLGAVDKVASLQEIPGLIDRVPNPTKT